MSTTRINLAFEDGCSVVFAFEDAPTFGLSVPARPAFGFDVGTLVYSDYPEYEGEYVSVPTSAEQQYPTASRRMTADFTVRAIPVYRADNQDGVTVTIAES